MDISNVHLYNSYIMKLIITLLFCFSLLSSFAQEIDSSWILSNYFPKYSRDTGTILTDFSFVDEKGQKRTLSELKGKILYINIWSTTCAPCIALFPDAEQLMKRLKTVQIDTLIQFVNICIDESKTKWKKVLKNYHPIGLNLYCKDTLINNLWNIDYFPRHILVNAEGRIMCYDFSRPDDGIIDYTLYAATKGIKPAESIWIDFRQNKYFRSNGRYTDDPEGKDYARWYDSVVNDLVEYFKWRQARQ